MILIATIIALIVSGYIAFTLGKRKIVNSRTKKTSSGFKSRNIRSLPEYYGYCAILWNLPVSIFFTVLLSIFAYNKLGALPILAILIAATFISSLFTIRYLRPSFKAREHFEKWLRGLLIFCAVVSVSITVLIFASVLFESIRFFEKVPASSFFFGLEWSPQTAMRADQAGSSGKFGIIPVFMGTLLITLISMCVAVPLGLMSAIYLTEYASPKFRNSIKPVLEILAGIPTVVYGYFAAVTFGPFLRNLFNDFGIEIASESALSAGIVMGIMIIPFVMSLSDDVMNAVPRSMRDGSLALGATKSETIKKVIFPAALPGIMGAILLAVSRAIGETMIVTMAAGLTAKLSFNPVDAVTTVTAQIVKLLVGDQEFDSAKTLAAFALSLTLFLITLLLNIAALLIVKKYRERYE
jgi:phosphate transport system permease protein